MSFKSIYWPVENILEPAKNTKHLSVAMKREARILGGVKSIEKLHINYEIQYNTGEVGRIFILNGHCFRYYVSVEDIFHDFPVPYNIEDVAKIVTKRVAEYDTIPFEISVLEEKPNSYVIDAEHILIKIKKECGKITVKDKRSNKEVLREASPLIFGHKETSQVLYQHEKEHFFGGGMQNGRFAHKGEIISIKNTNSWTDGGVTSPNPFYWSSHGYGVLRNTWRPGTYDFGNKSSENVETTHRAEYFDAFYFINSHHKDIISDYYQLTGRPLLVPEYAFYEAHLNTFNRDYWVEVTAATPEAILFEDGKYYKSYQPSEMDGKEGILESLNGELDNYQFSARAMIDRYHYHDMPLGWFLPNDGYGSGYGQTNSLQGDIENLKEFVDYSREHGVKVALWTESNLSPEDPKHPKKGDRDLRKEVSDACVVGLKCDVAWIGKGYSFGLNAVETATKMFYEATKTTRPFIITVDGWAGTQRYAGIWSGDQSGGEWEYIRFHIPTYIGSGLSGQPVVGSDMDGIYRGGDKTVNIRDYQWKTFTPLQLNMDGWGNVPKTPFTYDDEACNINRAYLKLKSMLMPYNYTINYESIHSLPMIRCMFLEFPQEHSAYTNDSKYQFMWGPSILVAPVFKPGAVRNEIYLPHSDQVWIDLFTGEMYQGGKIYNNFEVPLWKIPVFIRNGAIIPMTGPNNNPTEIQRDIRIFNLYPNGESSFEVYEDDGISMDYAIGYYAKTKLKMVFNGSTNGEGDLIVNIEKTLGKYKGMVKERITMLQIMTSAETVNVELMSHGVFVPLKKAVTFEDFHSEEDVYFIKKDFVINPYLKDFAENELKQQFLLIKLRKVDVTKQKIILKVIGYANKRVILGRNTAFSLPVPSNLVALDNVSTQASITLTWNAADQSTRYEIDRDGVIFTNIIGNKYTFEGFEWSSSHSFRIRALNGANASGWSEPINFKIKEDPTVKGVKVSCNLPCQHGSEVNKLTDSIEKTMWHTDWEIGKMDHQKGQILKLKFDLKEPYEIEKVVYIPRDDAGNGTFLKVQFRHSCDGDSWTPLSENDWRRDSSSKVIELNGSKMRYFELCALKTVGDFGSAKKINFIKRKLT